MYHLSWHTTRTRTRTSLRIRAPSVPLFVFPFRISTFQARDVYRGKADIGGGRPSCGVEGCGAASREVGSGEQEAGSGKRGAAAAIGLEDARTSGGRCVLWAERGGSEDVESGCWCLVFGGGCLVSGVWCLVFDGWCDPRQFARIASRGVEWGTSTG